MFSTRFGSIAALFLLAFSALAAGVVVNSPPVNPPPVNPPPVNGANHVVIQGHVAGAAVDTDGSQYVTGSFSHTRNFDPTGGVDMKTPQGDADLFVTRFNADGSYGWTQTYSTAGKTAGTAVAVSNGIVYVAGKGFLDVTTTPPATGAKVGSRCDDQPTIAAALVLAFQTVSGTPVVTFGTNGVRTYTGGNGAVASSLVVRNATIYACGTVKPADGSTDTKHPFAWALDPITGADSATFGTSGVVVCSAVAGDAKGEGIDASANAVYVTGTIKMTITPPADGPQWWEEDDDTPSVDTQTAFVAALDPATGDALTSFGAHGLATFGDNATFSASGHGIFKSGDTVYVTGSYAPMTLPPYVIAPPPPPDDTDNDGDDVSYQPLPVVGITQVYALGLNAESGTAQFGFGDVSGAVFFGRQFDSTGRAVTVANNTLYVVGDYGDSYTIGSKKADKDCGDAEGRCGDAAPSPVEHVDALVWALDPLTGAPLITFDADGFATFGGTGDDHGRAVATGNGKVYVAGGFNSTDAGVDSMGTYSATGWDGFLVGFDAVAGYYHVTETDQPPIVYAGADKIIAIPNPNSTKGHTHSRCDGSDGGDNSFAEAKLKGWVSDDALPNPPGTIVTVQWMQVTATATDPVATIEDPTSIRTKAEFPALGVYVFQLTADDGTLTSSATVKVTVETEMPPVIVSGPVATPAEAKPGDTIAFGAVASDPNGNPLDYAWDYGDGNDDDGPVVTHSYDSAGTYKVTLDVSNGIDDVTGTVTVVISDKAPPAFVVKVLHLKLSATASKPDAVSVAGVLGSLPSDFNPSGATVQLNIGSETKSFVLGGKGSARDGGSSFKMHRKGHVWAYQAKVLESGLGQMLGVTKSNGGNLSVPVSLSIAGQSYQTAENVRYGK